MKNKKPKKSLFTRATNAINEIAQKRDQRIANKKLNNEHIRAMKTNTQNSARTNKAENALKLKEPKMLATRERYKTMRHTAYAGAVSEALSDKRDQKRYQDELSRWNQLIAQLGGQNQSKTSSDISSTERDTIR